MDEVISAAASQFIPIIGAALAGLVTWGLAILKKKTNADIAKTALEQVDMVVTTVVGGLSQTVVEALKSTSENGKLTDEEKAKVKQQAVENIKFLLSESVSAAAAKTIGDLNAYITQKIEDQVLRLKK